LQEVPGLRSFLESPEAEKQTNAPAGVPGSQPTCRQGHRDSHVPRQVAASGSRGRRSAEMVVGSSGSGFQERSWVVPQFPAQFGCCCFSSAGKKPSRENDYYIILKEYGLGKAEAAASHVLLGDRLPGLTGTPRSGGGHATSRRSLWAGAGTPRCAATSLPVLSCPGVRSFRGPFLCPFLLVFISTNNAHPHKDHPPQL
jgi:hypothetical protein